MSSRQSINLEKINIFLKFRFSYLALSNLTNHYEKRMNIFLCRNEILNDHFYSLHFIWIFVPKRIIPEVGSFVRKKSIVGRRFDLKAKKILES